MLTIFEYLRKRACESIVAGVHDAVESLNRSNHTSDSNAVSESLPLETAVPIQPEQTTPPTVFDPDRYLTGPGKASREPHALPPPRRRGRPRKRDHE